MSKTARNVLVTIGVVLLLLIIVGAVAFLVLSRGFLAGYRFMGPGFMRGFGFYPFGGGLLSLVLGVLIVVGIVWFVTALARSPEPPRESMPMSESPLDILKRRYAKGEITKEQFEEMKRDIGV